jgi:AcrR family transcriptional regulator
MYALLVHIQLGLCETSNVARPRLIDRAGVLQASLDLADERGLDGLTMQAVADRLGVTPMALYRHVRNKADLLDGLVERLLDEIASSRPATEIGWDSGLVEIGQALRGVARRHPAVFPLLLERPASTPAAKRTRDYVYDGLRAAGVAEADVPRVERIVSTAILGFAASEVNGRFAAHSRRVLDADFDALVEMLHAGLAAHVAR